MLTRPTAKLMNSKMPAVTQQDVRLDETTAANADTFVNGSKERGLSGGCTDPLTAQLNVTCTEDKPDKEKEG